MTMIVGDREHFARYAKDFMGQAIELPTDDCWVRDTGPITVLENGSLTMVDFIFNGWGGKYPAERDDALPARLHRKYYPELDYRRVESILEGGAIDTNGAGVILTTSQCLLSAGRNGFSTKQEAEQPLREWLGAQRILWLDHGELPGDDTDGHVDTLARFLDAHTIAYVGPPPRGHPRRAAFVAMRKQLASWSAFKLVELPWAGRLRSQLDGHYLPASYANFLLSNGRLFLPVFGLPTDDIAATLLRRVSDYEVVLVNCRNLVEQHGALHCLTMQLPAKP